MCGDAAGEPQADPTVGERTSGDPTDAREPDAEGLPCSREHELAHGTEGSGDVFAAIALALQSRRGIVAVVDARQVPGLLHLSNTLWRFVVGIH